MTGPTVITATHRLSFQYTVSEFPHKCRNFCEAVASGDPSGYDVLGRFAGHAAGVQDVVDAFFTTMAPFYDADWATFDGWTLEQRVGTEFVYVAGGSTTIAPTGSGSPTPAVGWCVAGKSSDNKFFPAYVFEGNFRILDKVTGYTALNTAEKAVIDYFFRVAGTALDTDAANWRESRGTYHSARWLSAVWDSNQKLRRARRIA